MKKGVDHIGVAVVYLCHDGQGKYIFAKRGEACRDEQGTWDTGSGALEFGDTTEETLRREIAEEYGTDVLEYEFLGFRDVHRGETHWVALDYKVRVDSEKAHNAEPHKFDEFGWFALTDLPTPLHSQIGFAIEKYRNSL